jgi:predicted membrane protein
MNKLMVSFAFAWLLGQIIGGALEGRSNLVVTTLTASMTQTSIAAVHVTATDGFPATGVIIIEGEIIRYTSVTATTFTGVVTRGAFRSDAKAHSSGTRVYNETTGALQQSLGFNLAETLTSAGPFRILTALPGFFTTSVARFVLWDFSFFSTELWGFPLVYIQMFMVAISVGLVSTLVIVLISAAQFILQRVS